MAAILVLEDGETGKFRFLGLFGRFRLGDNGGRCSSFAVKFFSPCLLIFGDLLIDKKDKMGEERN